MPDALQSMLEDFGGNQLRDQLDQEAEEQRRKKRIGLQMPVPGMKSQLGPGLMSLLGQMNGRGF